jgi:hypothetical protein
VCLWLYYPGIENKYGELEGTAWLTNMNKLSLVGMQLPVKYKDNSDVSSEGLSSGITKF